MMDFLVGFLAGAILAIWLSLFIALSWNPKYRAVFNILMGLAAFIVCGAFYLIPFWLIFMR